MKNVVLVIKTEVEDQEAFDAFLAKATESFAGYEAFIGIDAKVDEVMALFPNAGPQVQDNDRYGETFWNGEPTPARRCTVKVSDSGVFPQYWAREAGLVGTVVSAVEVDYNGQLSYLFDGDGSGWRKVTEGRGGPAWPHKNIDVEGEVTYK